MSCDAVIDRLDEFLDGQLSAEERRAVKRHLERCARCRSLFALAAQEPDGPATGPSPDLTQAVLARTSGAPCDSAHRRLGDHVDGLLGPLDDELVRGHLQSCEECASLVRVLARMRVELPQLAELQPDERLFEDVLARTRPRRARPRWTARWSAAWQRLLARPRFAWEGAYVGTFMLVLLFGMPASPLAGVSRRALDLASKEQLAGLERPVSRLESRVSSDLEAVWRATRANVVDPSRAAATDLVRRSASTVDGLKTDLGTFWERITSELPTEDLPATGQNKGAEGEDR